jgi:hypothetical protein
MTGDGKRLNLRAALAATVFEVRVLVISPGCGRGYDEAEWRDALVEIESGVLELEFTSGTRQRFGSGDVLWLAGLPIRALHNPGLEPCTVVAASRRGSGGSGHARPCGR